MRPIVNFFSLSVCGKKGEEVLKIKDNLVTFHAFETHPVKGIYPRRTFNAWDSVADRVKKLNLKPGSEISVVAEMEHYIGTDGIPRDSFQILKIDFIRTNTNSSNKDKTSEPEEKGEVKKSTEPQKENPPIPEEKQPERPKVKGEIGIEDLENLFK